MANRYWVGGAGTWNTTSTTNWSASSGGASGASVPTTADSVFFDQAGTYTVTMTGALACLDITVSAGTVTFATGTTPTLNVAGSMSLISGITWNMTGTITFTATTTGKTIDSGLNTINSNITFNGVGGAWSLTNPLTMGNSSTTGVLSILAGSFTLNGQPVVCYNLSSSGASSRTLDISNSQLTATSPSPSINFAGSNFTFTSTNSTVDVNFNTGGITTTGGYIFDAVSFSSTAAGTRQISGPNTFTTGITVTGPASAGVSILTFSANQTIESLNTISTAGNRRVFFASATYGLSQTLTINSAGGLTDADFRGIYVQGAAAPISGTRIGNRGECRNITFSTPKTVYWATAAGGSWSGNNWATSAGGAVNTNNFPLAQDTATFVNTGLNAAATVTWDGAISYSGTVDMSARTSSMTLALSAQPTIYGNWKNGIGTTLSGTSSITFSGGGTQSITSASKTFTNIAITIDTYGGTVSLIDNLSISSADLVITNGTFDSNSKTMTLNGFASSNSNIRTVSLGSSSVSIAQISPSLFLTSTNLTFNCGTSTITFSNAGDFYGGGQTFYNVSLPSFSSISGQNTFTNLTISAPASTGVGGCTFSQNQTVTGTLTCAGASAVRRVFLQSSGLSNQRTLTVNSISAADCDFRDINIAGAASGASPTRAGDCGGNSGITFPVAKTVYWNLAGAQNWSAAGWATSSGGVPALNNFPLAQDTAVFNNAGSVTGTITINTAWNIGTFDASGRTSGMTLTTSTSSPVVYGDWKFGTGVTSSSTTGTITFSKRGTQTITSNGVQFGCNVTFDVTTVQLADALSLNSARTLTLQSGTFDAVTYNVTTGLFSAPAPATLRMGTGTWTLSGTGTVWSVGGFLTLIHSTSTIVLSNTSTTARTFTGAGYYYNKLTIGGTTGTSTLTISGANTFGELASTKTVAHTITLPSSTTTTVGKWSVTGTLGNVVTLAPSTAATAYTLSIAGPANTGIDYLSISYCTVATTSPGEFYVGVNSTNTAGNTRVIFTATPAPRTLYWVGGTGNWSSTTKWSTSSGGASGAAIPTSLDAVNFDSASNATGYTATVDAGVTLARCASFTFDGPASGSAVFAGSVGIAFHGNVSWGLPASGVANSYTGAMQLAGNSSYTFTPAAGLLSNVTVIGTASTWTLGSNYSGSSNSLTITNGSFSTSASNYLLTVSQLVITGVSVRSLSLNGSTVTISTAAAAAFSALNTSNLTFNAGASQINLSGATSGISSGGLTFNNVSFTSAAATAITITGANTFNTLSFAGRTTVGITPVTFNANQTISTLTLNAGTDAAYRTLLASSTIGTQVTLSVGALTAGAADYDFRDIAITGAAAPLSGTRFGDCKGNSGISFDAAKTVYYRQTGSASWGTTGTGSWALTSGGAFDATAFPLAQDTAVFPAATYPASGSTTTINANYSIGTIDMSLRTSNTMTLANGSVNPAVYGDWINGTGTTLTGTGVIAFAGRTTQQITSAGKTFTQQFNINSPGGSVTLLDAFSSSSQFFLTQGTFDANNWSVSISSLANTSSSTRTLALGSAAWTVTSTGASAWLTTSTGLTVTGSATINMSAASAKTFSGGGVNYSGITLNQSGAGTLTISGSNTFKDITNTYSATGASTISFGNSITTLSQFTGTGLIAKVLSLSGTSAVAPATLILSSGNLSGVDYLSVSFIRAYPLTDAWYAGGNSTLSNFYGWIPTPAPVNYGRFFLMFG